MFDIPRRRFVFEQLVYAGDGKWCGWLMRYYAPEAHKHREMFFSHLLEIYAMARRWDADVYWENNFTPEIVTALEYIKNYDSEPVHPPDIRYGDTNFSQKMGRYHKGLKEPSQPMELDDDGMSFEAWADEPGIIAGNSPWEDE